MPSSPSQVIPDMLDWKKNLGIGQAKEANNTHTITPAVREVCHSKAKAGLRRSLRGLHRRTRLSSLLRLNLDSRVTQDSLVLFHCNLVSLCTAPLQNVASMGEREGSTHNGCCDPKCPSERHLHVVREDTWAPSKVANCAWVAADEAVGCTRAFLTMRRSSR
ncbi:uncharacterized protein TNCV_522341 [Trichonephila clavipes]|nr:uncharacterized protein TNCV_522341 [Trichonephila clavipes]